jgi:hypothetical protein
VLLLIHLHFPLFPLREACVTKCHQWYLIEMELLCGRKIDGKQFILLSTTVK